jgi:hypothetical protein
MPIISNSLCLGVSVAILPYPKLDSPVKIDSIQGYYSGYGSRSQATASASKTGPSVQDRRYSPPDSVRVYTTQPRQHPIPQPIRLSRET